MTQVSSNSCHDVQLFPNLILQFMEFKDGAILTLTYT